MKLNPKLDSFIQNKIKSSKENRHILFEDSDLINLEKLILETATNDQTKEECLDSVNQDINGRFLIHALPFKVIDEVVDCLLRNKKEKGRKKVWTTLYKYFPNWDQIVLANRTSKLIEEMNHSEAYLQLYYKELCGGKTNVRQTTL